MKKVHIVTNGSYSDYHVVAVFSEDKLEIAERVAKECGEEGEVVTYDLDVEKPVLPVGMVLFRVTMKRNGDHASAHSEAAHVSWNKDFKRDEIKLSVSRGAAWISSLIAARDKEHAIKILNERRTQILAMPMPRQVEIMEGTYKWPDVLAEQPVMHQLDDHGAMAVDQ